MLKAIPGIDAVDTVFRGLPLTMKMLGVTCFIYASQNLTVMQMTGFDVLLICGTAAQE